MATVIALIFSSWLILQSPAVQTYLTQKLALKLSEKYNTTITVQGVSITFFKEIILKDVLIEDQKHDSLLFVHELVASIDSFSIKKRYVSINQLKLDQTFLYVSDDSSGKSNYQFLLESFKLKDTLTTDSLNYDFIMNQFDFNDARIRYAYVDSTGPRQILLDDISVGVSEMKLIDENIAFRINRFTLNDQKEFTLDDFSASFVATPDSVIITQLHAKTPNSEIVEANLYVDKSKIGPELDFKKLKFNLDLKKSVVSLKDVGLLVPALKGMDENIEVSGQASGKLADIKGKNI
ncbi:hypothetical protein JZU61_05095, partial [bacterium]|nr:hypothetical protein [bacterium]